MAICAGHEFRPLPSKPSWHRPVLLDREGENVHITEGNRGKVAEVEYEFTPEAPLLRMGGEEMLSGLSYARPVRIVVKATCVDRSTLMPFRRAAAVSQRLGS